MQHPNLFEHFKFPSISPSIFKICPVDQQNMSDLKHYFSTKSFREIELNIAHDKFGLSGSGITILFPFQLKEQLHFFVDDMARCYLGKRKIRLKIFIFFSQKSTIA